MWLELYFVLSCSVIINFVGVFEENNVNHYKFLDNWQRCQTLHDFLFSSPIYQYIQRCPVDVRAEVVECFCVVRCEGYVSWTRNFDGCSVCGDPGRISVKRYIWPEPWERASQLSRIPTWVRISGNPQCPIFPIGNTKKYESACLQYNLWEWTNW